MLAAVKQPIRTSLTLLVTFLVVAVATEGCAMLRRRAAERPPYRKVSPSIAYEIMRDTPSLLIVDLRSPQAFHGDTGHIYRAYNIPEVQLPYRLLELSLFREETFLVYCDTAKCSEDGMAVLVSSGFENAILIDGGIDRWIAKGFRTVLPAELAGRTQQASQGEAKPLAEAPQEESPAVGPKDPPNLQQTTAGTAAAPVLCAEPHVPVQKPPR